jgi:hypothetical protein
MSYDTTLHPLDLDLDLEQLERTVAPTLGERLGWRRERTGGWLTRHAIDIVVLAVLLVVACVVHMRGMYDSPARFDDEGTYTAYAWAVEYTHRLGHYTYWYAHPPLGWMQMAAWNWLTDAFSRAPYAVAAERQFMVICKVVSVALVYGLALRLRMTRIAAAGAVLLFALSPLAVYFTRTALLDNIVTPWLLAAFFLAASPRRGLGAAAGSAICFSIAVLSKETALLFLPALAVLFWQCSDSRNRRFGVTVFCSTLVLIGSMYPLYALIKNELLQGPGHVSLEWAIKWQLSGRQGSGSIFDPKSTAHTVVHTWFVLDPWLPKLALLAIVPGLVFRRSRAVAIAFAIQVVELLRGGYLPYPFVVAMIPFAALTAAGVLDLVWQAARVRFPEWVSSVRVLAWLVADRTTGRGVVATRPSWIASRLHASDPAPPSSRDSAVGPRGRLFRTADAVVRVLTRAAVLGVVLAFIAVAEVHWTASIRDLWHNDRDAGKAAALAWVQSNVDKDQRVVVDDSLWVDLVRDGYSRDRIIWFTKLDVDPEVKLPATQAWRAIDYVVLDHQDELSVHLNNDGTPSASTVSQFPTLGKAIKYSQKVGTFGRGGDQVTVWRVVPELATPPRAKVLVR